MFTLTTFQLGPLLAPVLRKESGSGRRKNLEFPPTKPTKKMKKTIAILALAATSAYGQDFINWNTLLDTAGNALGSGQEGSQIFDISTDGSGCFLRVDYGVEGGNFVSGPGGSGLSINNLQLGGAGANWVSFTLTNATADFDILSQATNTAAAGEFGTLTSNQAIDYTVISGLTSITGDNTNTVTYGSATNDNGQFSATIAGATTFRYEYNTALRGTTNSTDAFRFAVSNINASSHVPEPSTALLGVLAGLGFIARRRRA